MPDLRSRPRTRYGVIQTSSQPFIKYGVNSSRELHQRLSPGFPGMAPFMKTVAYGQTMNSHQHSHA